MTFYAFGHILSDDNINELIKIDLAPFVLMNIPTTRTEKGTKLYLYNSDGVIKTFIEIGEKSTTDSIKKIIPDAILLRNQVFEYQGPLSPYFEELVNDHKKGKFSYAEFAGVINTQLDEAIKLWVEENNPTHINQVMNYLQTQLRMDPMQILDFVNEAIDKYEEGYISPKNDFPIDKDKIRSIFRGYLESRVHKYYQDDLPAQNSMGKDELTLAYFVPEALRDFIDNQEQNPHYSSMIICEVPSWGGEK